MNKFGNKDMKTISEMRKMSPEQRQKLSKADREEWKYYNESMYSIENDL